MLVPLEVMFRHHKAMMKTWKPTWRTLGLTRLLPAKHWPASGLAFRNLNMMPSPVPLPTNSWDFPIIWEHVYVHKVIALGLWKSICQYLKQLLNQQLPTEELLIEATEEIAGWLGQVQWCNHPIYPANAASCLHYHCWSRYSGTPGGLPGWRGSSSRSSKI